MENGDWLLYFILEKEYEYNMCTWLNNKWVYEENKHFQTNNDIGC